ncbi:hypothetical protein AVEN_151504-1 [Araneus ventricosus]|uniref:Uncharacterized protein n=1 Tax=Araneus ventricosus TaxID=182803 RepID=A0A4Y2B4Q9_ARAVE|nr:hypothetical protein AVEN_151504-1 [Araneus ventricosus]
MNSTEIFTILTTNPMLVKFTSKLLQLSCSQDNMGKSVIHIYKLFNEGWFWVLGIMIGEDLQKFSESRVMRTIAIGRLPIRNLPKMMEDWQSDWEDEDTGWSTFIILPRVSTHPCCWKREEILFFIGHGPFPSYLKMFNLASTAAHVET